MAPPQLARFIAIMLQLDPRDFHHGGCIGADTQAHKFVHEQFGDKCKVWVHPATTTNVECFEGQGEIVAHRPALQRNMAIVMCSHVMVAAPQTVEEVIRSGTWATIRAARARRRPLYLVRPDGTYKLEFANDFATYRDKL